MRLDHPIGLRDLRAMPENSELWDGGTKGLAGFGARRQKGKAVAFVLMYRTAENRLRRHTIGRWGPLTPDEARKKAKAIGTEVNAGADPAARKLETRRAMTMKELCERYLADAEAGKLLTRKGKSKKASTIGTDRSRITAHILPRLGHLKVKAVTRADVESFMENIAEGKERRRVKLEKPRALSNIRGGKGAASRTIGLLGAIFTYAEKRGLIDANPVRGVVRYADGQRNRRLSDSDYAALGRALDKAAAPPPPAQPGEKPARSAPWPAAIAATRFLLLTGWRSGEALTLTWGMVDLPRRTARLPDTKTGESIRPLSAAACDILRAQHPGQPDRLVFPPVRGDATMAGFPKMFERIGKLGELPADITPHVLRHSFVSLGNDLGYTEATIGMLVGHKGTGSTTSGYIHAADDVLLNVADRIASATLRKLAGEGAAVVVEGPGTSAKHRAARGRKA
jgi:integrase